MKVQEVQIKDAYISSKSVSHKRKKLYDILEKSFIIAGLQNNLYPATVNEYQSFKIPLEKIMQKGNMNAFSMESNDIVIGKNVSLVKITQNFECRILNSFCVNTQINGSTSINSLRCYAPAINNSSNIQRTFTTSTIIEVKEGDRLDMKFWSTLGNVTDFSIEAAATTLIIEAIG